MVFVYIVGFIIFLVIVSYLNSILDKKNSSKQASKNFVNYQYGPKDSVMTSAEVSFFKRLERVADGRYHIFPQIHLSSLMINKTDGRYHKAAFNKINSWSVDYVLCDKVTLKAVYAVELDDSFHDTAKGQRRDRIVEKIFADVQLPLVRFRNVDQLTDDQIAEKFEKAVN